MWCQTDSSKVFFIVKLWGVSLQLPFDFIELIGLFSRDAVPSMALKDCDPFARLYLPTPAFKFHWALQPNAPVPTGNKLLSPYDIAFHAQSSILSPTSLPCHSATVIQQLLQFYLIPISLLPAVQARRIPRLNSIHRIIAQIRFAVDISASTLWLLSLTREGPLSAVHSFAEVRRCKQKSPF